MSTYLIDQMFNELRNNPEALIAYQQDFLVHDIAEIKDAKLGDQFVWIVRDHGTHLQPLGTNPEYALAVMDSEGIKFIRLVTVTHENEGYTPCGDLTRINKVQAASVLERRHVKLADLK